MPLNKVIVYAKQLVGIHLLIFLTPLVRSEKNACLAVVGAPTASNFCCESCGFLAIIVAAGVAAVDKERVNICICEVYF